MACCINFRKKSTTTEAMKNIWDMYPDAVKGRTCKSWFKKFKYGDWEISNKPHSGK